MEKLEGFPCQLNVAASIKCGEGGPAYFDLKILRFFG